MTSQSSPAALFGQENREVPLHFARFFAEIGNDDVPLVGGKKPEPMPGP